MRDKSEREKKSERKLVNHDTIKIQFSSFHYLLKETAAGMIWIQGIITVEGILA